MIGGIGNEKTGACKNAETYACWMCNEVHTDPAAYLWHIRSCKSRETGRQGHGRNGATAKGKAGF